MTPGQPIRVLVTGGRDYRGRLRLNAVLDRLDAKYPIQTVIHGAARGTDTLADDWARARNREVEAFPADWDAHGKSAGPIRNRVMLRRSPDCVVAFPGGRGTNDMVQAARKAGLPIWDLR